MVTVRELVSRAQAQLEAAGNDNAAFEARELAAFAMGTDVAQLMAAGTEQASEGLSERLNDLCRRRAEGEPLQYILGEWEFCGLPFKVGRGVLIPRQDTETVVEQIVDKYKKLDNITLIDLCAGTGCIGITAEKLAGIERVLSVELYPGAAEHLKENIRLNGSGAEVVIADVLDPETAKLLPEADVIVCNPPYLTAEEMKTLQREVSFEPETALYGGEDGLDFYRAVVRLYKEKLKPGGMIFFEIGASQAAEVMAILIQHGFRNVRSRKDSCGNDRCVFAEVRGKK
ncbi:MAG: peptide chain release factor N(5)-glutamine methyltransferase [Ruminococcus sp.]|nr:peptide chain release factor N(5)-glutamine methyltransferase [Ruminococcus sp.]